MNLKLGANFDLDIMILLWPVFGHKNIKQTIHYKIKYALLLYMKQITR